MIRKQGKDKVNPYLFQNLVEISPQNVQQNITKG